VGIVSSRKIKRACYEDLAFRVLTANQKLVHSRISEIRCRNLDALKGLFIQILHLFKMAGIVSLGHVALDGTKVEVNAFKHKAMSHVRMLRAEKELEKEISALMRRAEIQDAQDDQRYGKGNLGSELPVARSASAQRLSCGTSRAVSRKSVRPARSLKLKPLLQQAGSGISTQRRPGPKQPQLMNRMPRQRSKMILSGSRERPWLLWRRSSSPSRSLAWNHRISSPWPQMRCHAVARKDDGTPTKRRSGILRIPRAISCSQEALHCSCAPEHSPGQEVGGMIPMGWNQPGA
jgi:hypothetical protein